MATTSRKVTELALGIRDTTGAVVASGKARFYQPGTLVAQTVYSDDVCTTPISPPLTLNAGGQGTVYTLEPVRMIVKDSTETTTYYDSIVNLNRHDAVYVTHASWNSGTEQTLENLLTTLGTSLGANGKYLPTGTATARNYADVLTELVVSVKTFGAVGDGTTDDTTAIQNTVNYVESLGGGWAYFPKGTFKITSAITIDTVGVKVCGAGRGIAIIKNFGTTTNALTVTLSGAADAKIIIRDVSITCNTTSTAKAIESTNGDRVAVYNVATALHQKGIDTSAVSGCIIKDCVVESTDDNGNAVGITGGPRGRIIDCEVISATDNGFGIIVGNDGTSSGGYVSNFATGILLNGNRSHARSIHVTGATTGATISGTGASLCEAFITGCTTGASITGTSGARVQSCTLSTGTTGISLAATDARAIDNVVASYTTGISMAAASTIADTNVVTGATTGITLGAHASCHIKHNSLSSNTTDISINSSATLLVEAGNTYTTLSDSRNLPHAWIGARPALLKNVTKSTVAGATPSFTPTPATCQIFVCEASHAAGAVSATVAATATTGLVDGQVFIIVVQKINANVIGTITWNAQYVSGGSSVIASGSYQAFTFRWDASGSTWNIIATSDNDGATSYGAPW